MNKEDIENIFETLTKQWGDTDNYVNDLLSYSRNLQQRIDKSIEYINELKLALDKENKYLEDKYNGKVYMYKVNYVQDLLEILRGEDNE